MWVFALFGLVAATPNPDKTAILTQRTDLDGVIVLNTSEYDYFVVSPPRPYTLIVLFTADLPKQKCPNCKEIANIFRSIAYSYANSHFSPRNQTDTPETPVFFAKMDSNSDSLQLFQAHSFLSLPVLAVTHPYSVLLNDIRYEIPKADVWEVAFTSISSKKLLDFVNSRTGHSIELISSPYEAILGVSKWLGVAICLAFVLITMRKPISSPKFMVFVAILVYFMCVSGSIYLVLNGSPLLGGRKGSPEYIHKHVNCSQVRHQYIAEGYYTGLMVLLGALGLVLLNSLDSGGNG